MNQDDLKKEKCKQILKRAAWRIQYHERKRYSKETEMIETIGTDQIEEAVSDNFVKEILEGIPSPKGRYIIQKIVLDGWTEKEVAKSLNMSQQGVHKCKTKYLNLLKQTLSRSVH